jgi:hypothetical protein
MNPLAPCPNCKSTQLYRTLKPVGAGGGYAPNYLPGLGPWYAAARFDVVVCRDCGHTRWFASDEARKKLGDSQRWTRA